MTCSEEMLSQAVFAHVKNHEQGEDALSDFEDILEPKRKENDKEDQHLHLDNLADFLDGFDDDELEYLL